MSKLWVAGSLVFILGITSTLFLICGRGTKPVASKQSNKAQVDLQEVVQNPPEWRKYWDLKEALTERWTISVDRDFLANQDNRWSQTVLRQQMDAIETMFNEEVRQKLNNLEKTLAEYIKNRQNQAEVLFKHQEADLNMHLAQELADKLEQNQSRLKQFRQQLQLKYQTTLSNLQIQLVMLDFSLEAKDVQNEKVKIEAELERLGREIEERVRTEQIRLQTAYDRFATQRKAENLQEQASYRQALDEEVKRDVHDFQAQLQDEFKKWRVVRESERDQAVKSRQNSKTVLSR